MTTPRPLTTQEIDDDWRLDEERKPSSGFEEAFWEQYEDKKLKRPFGDTSAFGAKRPN